MQADSDPRRQLAEAQAIRRLTLPAEMGEAVKFMALVRGLDAPPAGFGPRDHRHRL